MSSQLSQTLGSIGRSADFQGVEYAIRCYVAAMLSYYIALRIGLQNPFWALTTCYITAAPQRLAGAIMSKAIYRACGTLLGGVAAVVLVPEFVNEPFALSAALALWLGLCTYVSAIDRTPRAYLFVLAGYTAGIIGFPSVGSPGNIFNTAILREQEIILGIVCTTLVHAAILPRTLTQRMRERVDQILLEVEDCSRQSLTGRRDAVFEKRRRKVALDINELAAFSIQLPFDTARILPDARMLDALQDRLTLLVPVASAVEDRVAELAKLPEGMSAAAAGMIEEVTQWLHGGTRSDYQQVGAQLVERSRELAAVTEDDGGTWRRMLSINLLMRLADLVSLHRDARGLRDALRAESPSGVSPAVLRLLATSQARAFHRDHFDALWVGASAALAVMLGCLFWIATAWPAGAGAILIVGVSGGLFGGFPNAPRVMWLFLYGVVPGIMIAALYGYVLLPQVTDPVMYAIVLAPPLLLFGVVLARPPPWAILGLAAALGFLNTLGFANTYQGDFAGFANSALALCMGTIVTAGVFSVVRAGSVRYVAIGLLRAAYRDVALRARRGQVDSVAWTGRMLDRVGMLSATEQPGQSRETVVDVLTDMRTGHIAARLLELRGPVPARQQERIDAILAQLAAYYEGLDPSSVRPPPVVLLEQIDLGIRGFSVDADAGRGREGLSLLTGLRRNLFPAAAPFARDVSATVGPMTGVVGP